MTDTPPPPSTFQTRVTKETNKNTFKHSIKASIGNILFHLTNHPSDIFLLDKTFRFYKSSVASASGRSTPARGFSFDVMRPNAEPQTQTQTQTTSSQTMTTKDGREAWEVDMEGSSVPESESHFFFLFFCLSYVWRFEKRGKEGGFFLSFFLVFSWAIYIWLAPKTCVVITY